MDYGFWWKLRYLGTINEVTGYWWLSFITSLSSLEVIRIELSVLTWWSCPGLFSHLVSSWSYLVPLPTPLPIQLESSSEQAKDIPHSGDSMGFRNGLLGTWDKDQICTFMIPQATCNIITLQSLEGQVWAELGFFKDSPTPVHICQTPVFLPMGCFLDQPRPAHYLGNQTLRERPGEKERRTKILYHLHWAPSSRM